MEKEENSQFVFTFFSPSGYDQSKIPGNNYIRMMLPMDTNRNIGIFLELVKPKIMFVLASGVWPNAIKGLAKRNIPHYLISFHSRPGNSCYHPFLKWFYKDLYQSFTKIFTYPYHEGSELLIKHLECSNAHKVHNQRFDSISQMKKSIRDIEAIKDFVNDNFCFVAGSSEFKEDQLLLSLIPKLKHLNIKWIIVPHEKLSKTLNKYKSRFGNELCFYSQGINRNNNILVYDITGDLFHLYQYANIAMVGRGFHRKQIHNMLEPAVFEIPVLIGPKHKRFNEPIEFIREKLAFEFNNETELKRIIEEFFWEKRKIDKTKIAKIFKDRSGSLELIFKQLDVT